MMQKIWAIATNTFREAIRDRILYGFLFFAICLILFTLVLGQLSFNEEIRATVDIGMAGISLFAILMAIFLGISLLHKEIEKRSLYLILSKPVSRPAYMVGKFMGLTGTMVVQILLMTIVWLIVLGIQGKAPSSGLAVAVVLIVFETMLVISLALFFSSFSSPFLSGLFCLGIFIAGRNADLIAELAKRKSLAWMGPMLEGVAAVVPNFYLFFPSGKMVEGSWATVHAQFVSSGYVLTTVGYGVIYSSALLLCSIILLNRRNFI